MKSFLAGGAVRDLLLGRSLSDRDYLVTEVTKQAFQTEHPAAREVGHAFPVFLLEGLEFSFPRADSLEEELRSRDLTVNAMLLDEEGELVCHPRALEDLHHRVLRPASERSLLDDPLRVFRAARFWAVLPEFSPHEELVNAMRETARRGLLDSIAADRVGVEVRKAMAAAAPGNFLRLLARADCLSPWFEEFRTASAIPAGPLPYHDTDVIEHTARVMDALTGDPLAAWAGLCHDIGKTTTPPEHWPSHHGHDVRGADMAGELARRLRLPNTYVDAGTQGARWHMLAGQYDQLRPGTRVDLLMKLHLTRTLDTVFALARADQDVDFAHRARKELATILKVRLPLELRDLKEESGRRLRDLRAQALLKATKSNS